MSTALRSAGLTCTTSMYSSSSRRDLCQYQPGSVGLSRPHFRLTLSSGWFQRARPFAFHLLIGRAPIGVAKHIDMKILPMGSGDFDDFDVLVRSGTVPIPSGCRWLISGPNHGDVMTPTSSTRGDGGKPNHSVADDINTHVPNISGFWRASLGGLSINPGLCMH